MILQLKNKELSRKCGSPDWTYWKSCD